MQYRAIEEGKALAPRVTKKSSFVAVAVIAVVCCVAGAMMFGGSSQLQNAVRSNVNCRNVRATAGVDRRAVGLSSPVSRTLLLHLQTPETLRMLAQS
eukprot:1375768-Amorphochlora_amoeboformis.AAC.2